MLKVAIVTDGPYGERAFDTIKEQFDCDFVVLETPESTFMDDTDIPRDALNRLESADIVISYILHPDLTLDLVEMLHDKVDWIIVGAWGGKGFKNQLEGYKNVTCPENMCDLEKNGNKTYDRFVTRFGKPIVEIDVENEKVIDVRVIRTSPCGSTFFVAREMMGQEVEKLPIKAGLKVQHYPCRAPKLRLFSHEESKKELAAKLHKEAFEKALK
jgi:hypothetical protein